MAIDPNTGLPIPEETPTAPVVPVAPTAPVAPLPTTRKAYYGDAQITIADASQEFSRDQLFQESDKYRAADNLGISMQQLMQQRRRVAGGSVTGDEGFIGDKEVQSYNERKNIASSGDFNTATSYWDAGRGVQVHAPHGTYFQLYANGSVQPVQGDIPTKGATPGSKGDDTGSSSLFTQGTQAAPGGGTMATPGFTQDQLGIKPAEGKTIARTGQTIKNPQTGVDEYAGEGEILIEYTDGTVENRKVSDINTPGSTTPIGEFGRTPEELGITRKTEIKGGAGSEVTRAPMTAAEALAGAKTPEEADAIIQAEGLSSTKNLEFIGQTYTDQKSGELRVAKQGNAFYQDPVSNTVLERPISLQSLAKVSTSPSVQAEAKLQEEIRKYLPQADQEQLKSDFQSDGMGSFQKMYTDIQESQGTSSIKAEIESIQKEQKQVDDEYALAVKEVNANPYYSEAQRSKMIGLENDRYETKKSQLTARLQLQSGLLDSARQEAQFIAQGALQQYNADRDYDFNVLKYEADRIDSQLDAEYKLKSLALQERQVDIQAANSTLKEVQGGLYDIQNNEWIIPPKGDTLSPEAYAKIISDVYQNYDPDEAEQVIQGITGKIGTPGQPLSLQSITPMGTQIGTKFGEKTFAQAHHSGVDIPAPMGSPALAPVDMTITGVGTNGGYGQQITATGSDGYQYRFAHLSGYNVKNGDTIKAGQQIGKVGSTGNSTGSHLHMEVMQNGQFIDPVKHFGLSSDSQVKSKAQKKADADALIANKKDAQARNQELVQGNLYKQMNIGGASITALQQFEEQFKKHGTTSNRTSPIDNAKLAPVYQSAVLNLKEFFNLGVLNGQDLVVLENVLPKPIDQGWITTPFLKTKTLAGISNLKKQMGIALDETYRGIISQYAGYSPEDMTSLKDVQDRFLDQKAKLDPTIGAKINQIKKENPGMTDAEIIQLIL